MIRLFAVPGVPEVETRVTLNELTGVRQDHQLDRMIERVWEEGFGTRRVTGWDFEFVDTEDDDVTYWRGEGWDVTGNDGKQLRCLEHFEEAMVLCQAGYTDKPMMELEAETWAAAKATAKEPDPRTKARDQSFLSLGPKRRRQA